MIEAPKDTDAFVGWLGYVTEALRTGTMRDFLLQQGVPAGKVMDAHIALASVVDELI